MAENKVTKQRDPKRQAAGRKGHEKYMAKLKEDTLKNVGNGGSSSSSNSTNGGGNSTNDSTNGGINTTNDSTNGGSDAISTTTSSTITNFSYIHGVGAIAVLSLGVCIFIIPKLMRNPSQRDKDPEKISKDPEKISKDPEKISKIRRKML